MNPLIALGAALVGGLIGKAVSSSEETSRASGPQSSRGAGPQTSYVITPVTPAGSAASEAAGHFSVVEGVRRLVV